jgi:exopolysaccharide production protein ExoQ
MSYSGNITAVSQPWGRQSVIAAPSYSWVAALETGFVVLALFLLTGGVIPLLRSESSAVIDPTQGGDPVMQVLQAAMYVIALFFFGVRPLIKSTFRDKWLLLMLVFCFVSAAWSADAGVTLRHSAALVGTSIFGMYFAYRFSVKDQIKLLAAALGLAAVLSVFFAVLLPKYGLMTDEHAGEWQGIYMHKNALGRTMVLGAMCFFMLARSQRKARLLWWGGFGLCCLTMLMTRSATALVALTLFFAAYPLTKTLRWPAWRWRYSLLTPVLFFSLVVVGLVLAWILSDPKHISAALDLLGRDKTLTNRTDLWSGVVYAIGKRPWWGYGYGAFWEADSQQLYDTWQIAGFKTYEAHNGVLQLMLDMGAIGTMLFLVSLVLTIRMAILWIRRRRSDDSFWPLFYLIFMLSYNVTEPTVLKHNNIYWMLYVAVVLTLHKSLDSTAVESRRPLAAPRM